MPQGVLGAEGHHELVLQEALGAVDAVPLPHAVQGMEEGADALDLAPALLGGLAEPRLVERGHARPVQQAAREDRRRHGQLFGPELQGVVA